MEIICLIFALMSILTVAFGSSGSPSCKEGALKCGGGTVGGVVFVCMGGRWHVLMACRTPQICTSAPIAKCTSSPFIAGSADIGAPAASGFEIPAPEVSAATDYKDINNVQGVAADDTASGYDICSPCSRFNDACKTECFSQGKGCDQVCDSMTCTANLTTGDARAPTIECGSSCKWSCY